MWILFQGSLLFSDSASGITLFPEQFPKIHASRPIKRPTPNHLSRHLEGLYLVPIEEMIKQEPSVGRHVVRIHLQSFIHFSGEQFLASPEEIDHRQHGVGAPTARIVLQGLSNFLFRFVEQGWVVGVPLENHGNTRESILGASSGELRVECKSTPHHPPHLLKSGW